MFSAHTATSASRSRTLTGASSFMRVSLVGESTMNKWNGLRRTPLKRQRGLSRRRVSIKSRSEKRAKFMREVRVPLVRRRINGKLCDRCHEATAVDVHEILPRSAGGSMTDDNNLADLCRRCHDWVTLHPRLAEVEGFRRFRHKIRDINS